MSGLKFIAIGYVVISIIWFAVFIAPSLIGYGRLLWLSILAPIKCFSLKSS